MIQFCQIGLILTTIVHYKCSTNSELQDHLIFARDSKVEDF